MQPTHTCAETDSGSLHGNSPLAVSVSALIHNPSSVRLRACEARVKKSWNHVRLRDKLSKDEHLMHP